MTAPAIPSTNAVWLQTVQEARWERRRYLSRRLAAQPLSGLAEPELRAHLDGMPACYWERVSESELVWGLRTIHAFFETVASSEAPPWSPIVDWRHVPERGYTKVMVCTWDRRGLLAKIAAAFGAVRINIIQAEVYTRADDIVLDVFRVCDGAKPLPPESSRLQQMKFLLEGALSEPPRFASTWAELFHKLVPYENRIRPLVVLDNDSSAEFTLINIEASDRVGLLYDILRALEDMRLNVVQAEIDTNENVACDIFYVTDSHGSKVTDPHQVRIIGDVLSQELAGDASALE